MCSVRPTLGREGDASWGYHGFSPVATRKKVLVVGGGPAGLQTAAVAAERGHAVTVWEKKDALGGALLLAARVDEGARELLRPIRYLERACRKAGVEIVMGREATPDLVVRHGFDTVVIATGGVAAASGTKNDLPHFTPEDVMTGNIEPPPRLLILGGDGVGLGVAVFLLRNGDYELTILEGSGKVGRDVNPFYLWGYTKILRERKATLLKASRLNEVAGNEARISGGQGEKKIIIDGIIVARREKASHWMTAESALAKGLFFVGDAKRPRRLQNAIHDGYRMGMVL